VSTAVQVGSSFFLDVTQRVLVVTEVSAQPTGPIFIIQAWNLEDGTDRLYRNVGNYQYPRCVTSKKSEYLVKIS
jgi:hypothetical protein